MKSNGYRIAGMFLSCGNYSPVKYEDAFRLKSSEKREMPIYYSFGENDQVCTPAHQKTTVDQVKRSHFKNHRFSYHQNKHTMWQPHLVEALEWFENPD